ncbi:putative reverse transcriptase, RNA-dependent DNA polymerase [Tanacetum coccineum]
MKMRRNDLARCDVLEPKAENVVEISSDKVEGSRDWNSPEYQDTANSGEKKETKAMVFHKMDTEEVNNRFVAPCFVNGLEAYDGRKLIVALRGEIYFVKFINNPEEDDVEPGVIFRRSFLRMTKSITDFGARTITIYPDIDPFLEDIKEEEKSIDDWDQLLLRHRNFRRTSSSTGRHLTQEEAAKEELAIRISQKFALLEEVRPVLKTMAYQDEEAIKKVKGEALKEKHGPRAFIFTIRLEGQVNENALADTGSNINTMPYRIYEQLGREEIKKVDRGITMINHTHAEAMGILTNILCQVEVTTIIAKFLILDILIDRDAPIVVGRGFLYTISGIVNIPEKLFSTFDGICHQTFCAARSDVLRTTKSDSDDKEEYKIKINKFREPMYGLKPKKAVSFLGSLPVPLKQVNWKPDYKSCYTKEEEATGQWRTEIRLWEEMMMKPDHRGPNALDNLKPWRKYCFPKFTTSSCYGKVATEMLSLELCHEFYSTYEFDEVCVDDELQTNKIIKFRLGSRAHSLTLLEFSRRLGLYHADELDEEGFDVYILSGRKTMVLTDDVIRSMSALIYYRDLDTTTLIKLIDSKGRLVPEDLQPGVPRVGIPRPPRASMQDLYQGVFEHMAEVYSVPLQRAYNPLGYAQPQYDQYYQHYPPPPPQYQQQQQDDDE